MWCSISLYLFNRLITLKWNIYKFLPFHELIQHVSKEHCWQEKSCHNVGMQKAFASHEQFSCVLQQRPFSYIDIGKPEIEMIYIINSILEF